MKVIYYFILLEFTFLCSAIYLDQIGNFDWHSRYLGCPIHSWFERSGSQDILIITTNMNVIGRINVENGDILWRRLNDKKIDLLVVDGSSVIAKVEQKRRKFDLHTGTFLSDNEEKGTNPVLKQNSKENGLLKSYFDPVSGDLEIRIENEGSLRFKIQFDGPAADIKEIKVLSLIKGNYKILVERMDCSLALCEFLQTNQSLKQVWIRQESLSMISDVLMVDFPLSESQAQIESEFNQNESILRSFLLRIRSQLEQLHRFFLKTSENIAETIDLIFKGELSIPTVIKQIFNQVDRSKDGPFERDYFNMRKMIVVSTLAGTLHGLDSGNGRLIWTYYLGKKFLAYKNSKAPLFLLRGTSFFQWTSQAAVVFNCKDSIDSFILIFNPINGKFVEKIRISGGIYRVELLPFVSSEQLHSLLILRNNNPNKAEILPLIKDLNLENSKPIFLSMIDENFGILTGNEVNLNKNGMVTKRWQTTLPGFGNSEKNEIIQIIKGKDINEKVHSQGRVLGDRSVLYKYSNPNLIAILSSNPDETLLRINLFDSVSGLLVYSGRYTRANPPFHMVHCENWIVISYWNDKARRTEIGVIELFEGLQQVNSSAFGSLSASEKSPMTLAQTYIFSQGISTISTTQTMQGLTSRSILIALPSGGILEMSRRFLDARRPLEMLPEHREEMLIPYIPELPFATEDFINYNQTVARVREIRSAPSGLESSSLIFVFGLDLFYTRVMPSGTFDILKDDFDYAFIFLVMVFLTVASYICKRISRHQSIQKAWE